MTRICVFLAIASFAAMIILSIIGNLLHSKGIIRDGSTIQHISAAVFFTLFALYAASAIPAKIFVFVAAQSKIGNADVGMVCFLAVHANGVTFAFWSIFLLGFLIALPVMWTNFSSKSSKDVKQNKNP